MDSQSLHISASTVWPEILDHVEGDVKLFPHQIDSVGWLYERETNGIRTNLIGDIMGLGKTMTTTTLLSLNVLDRTLIVCPKSLLCQWSRELISQHHRVYFITPSYSFKITVYNNKVTFHKEEIRHSRTKTPFVAITSYGKVKPFPEPKHTEELCMSVFDCVNEQPEGNLVPFRRVVWDRIVVDEIHNLRNGVSLKDDKTAQLRKKSLRCFRMSRLRKTKDCFILGCTGTPLQNRIGDLASIFLFLGCYVSYRVSL